MHLSDMLLKYKKINEYHVFSNEIFFCFYHLIHKYGMLTATLLSQVGSCKHTILKRIQTGWLKFRELAGLFIGKGMSVKSKGIIYTACTRPAMLYGSET